MEDETSWGVIPRLQSRISMSIYEAKVLTVERDLWLVREGRHNRGDLRDKDLHLLGLGLLRLRRRRRDDGELLDIVLVLERAGHNW